jgi:hypothetical protein
LLSVLESAAGATLRGRASCAFAACWAEALLKLEDKLLPDLVRTPLDDKFDDMHAVFLEGDGALLAPTETHFRSVVSFSFIFFVFVTELVGPTKSNVL